MTAAGSDGETAGSAKPLCCEKYIVESGNAVAQFAWIIVGRKRKTHKGAHLRVDIALIGGGSPHIDEIQAFREGRKFLADDICDGLLKLLLLGFVRLPVGFPQMNKILRIRFVAQNHRLNQFFSFG